MSKASETKKQKKYPVLGIFQWFFVYILLKSVIPAVFLPDLKLSHRHGIDLLYQFAN